MVDSPDLSPIEARTLRVQLEPGFYAASLRYFEANGAFAGIVRRIIGLSIPTDRSAASTQQAGTILAWRGPSETILLTTDSKLPDTLRTATAASSDGCLVDLRGGLPILRAQGDAAVADLVARKAGHGAMPAIGESCRTRFAEVALLIVKVRAGETFLVVDRMYAPHVLASIRTSAADL